MSDELHRYKVFISYNHRDEGWAKWLEQKLEGYRVPKGLEGKSKLFEPVPGRIKPVFRDRSTAAAGGHLPEQVKSWLDASESLVVICSPNSAKPNPETGQHWVDEEIQHFIATNKGHRIFALIVDGEPNAGGDTECFPPTFIELEPAAADAREHADGKELAFMKLTAGLLGVELIDLQAKQNEEDKRRAHRARITIWSFTILSALILLSFVIAVAQFWQSEGRLRYFLSRSAIESYQNFRYNESLVSAIQAVNTNHFTQGPTSSLNETALALANYGALSLIEYNFNKDKVSQALPIPNLPFVFIHTENNLFHLLSTERNSIIRTYTLECDYAHNMFPDPDGQFVIVSCGNGDALFPTESGDARYLWHEDRGQFAVQRRSDVVAGYSSTQTIELVGRTLSDPHSFYLARAQIPPVEGQNLDWESEIITTRWLHSIVASDIGVLAFYLDEAGIYKLIDLAGNVILQLEATPDFFIASADISRDGTHIAVLLENGTYGVISTEDSELLFESNFTTNSPLNSGDIEPTELLPSQIFIGANAQNILASYKGSIFIVSSIARGIDDEIDEFIEILPDRIAVLTDFDYQKIRNDRFEQNGLQRFYITRETYRAGLSPSGARVVRVSASGEVTAFNRTNSHILYEPQGSAIGQLDRTGVRFGYLGQGDRYFVITEDGTLRLYNDPQQERVFPTPQPVSEVIPIGEGNQVLLVGRYGNFSTAVFDLDERISQYSRNFDDPGSAIARYGLVESGTFARVGADSRYFVGASHNGIVEVHNISDLENPVELLHESAVVDADYFDGKTITLDALGTIRIWDNDSQDVIFSIDHQNENSPFYVAPEEERLSTISSLSPFRSQRSSEVNFLVNRRNVGGRPLIGFAGEEHFFVTGVLTTSVFQIGSDNPVASFDGSISATLPDGRRAIVSQPLNMLSLMHSSESAVSNYIIDLTTGETAFRLQDSGAPVFSFDLSEDGSRIVGYYFGNTVRVFNLEDGNLISSIALTRTVERLIDFEEYIIGGIPLLQGASISPDGSVIATWHPEDSSDRSVSPSILQLWDSENGYLLHVFETEFLT
ncbi:TIR domain-containing protein [Maricaulaceae bacterium EIL42A08]|nr:TIR domain-containing protein [Maricaulaceae bacterium EIL42A08]